MAIYKKSGGFGKRSGAPHAGGRSARPSSRPGGRPFGRAHTGPSAAPVERFQATCASCHTVCEVPFKPNGKKPVYCRDCFKGQEKAPKSEYRKSGSAASTDLSRQFELLNLKLDKLIKAVEAHSRQ